MRKVLLTTLLVLAPWQACAQKGNSAGWSPDTRTERAGVPSPKQSNYQDRLFGQIAAAGGLAEVDLGKLAADKASNPGVKQFAKRMVDDHEKANRQLKSIAQKSSIPLPSKTDAEHNKVRADLNQLNGPQFDRAYLTNQTIEHQKTAQLLAWEIKQGEDAEMQRFASELCRPLLNICGWRAISPRKSLRTPPAPDRSTTARGRFVPTPDAGRGDGI